MRPKLSALLIVAIVIARQRVRGDAQERGAGDAACSRRRYPSSPAGDEQGRARSTCAASAP